MSNAMKSSQVLQSLVTTVLLISNVICEPFFQEPEAVFRSFHVKLGCQLRFVFEVDWVNIFVICANVDAPVNPKGILLYQKYPRPST